MNRFLLLFGGIWLLVGLPFAITGIVLFRAEQHFAREARTATGIVLSRDIDRNRESDGSTKTRYSVRYRFTAPDGQVREGSTQLDRAQWQTLAEREPIEIAYAASDPSNHRVHGTSRTLLAIIFGGLGGAFTIAGAVIFSFGLRGSRRRRRLHETGMTADGAVTGVKATKVKINRQAQGRVLYEFRDDRGELRRSQSDYMPIDTAMEWKAGDRITIRYDRQRPQDSIWEPTMGAARR
jgi:hypothetical protein